jgi:Integrase zinc binding domain
MIIYTDHASTKGIANQTHMGSSATDKLNLRLIRASQYLSQFKLDIRHKPGKTNVVADSLSRLKTDLPRPKDSDVLEEFAFHLSLIELNEPFKKALRLGYSRDSTYRKILQALSEGKSLYHFYLDDGLLYFKSPDGSSRLCLPQNTHKDTFETFHDRNGHIGFHRLYYTIASQYYVRGLSRKLKKYLSFCPKCLTHQTLRHRPYGQLMPIATPDMPLQVLAMDFVVSLPIIKEEFSCCLTITDKFTKGVRVIAGKENYSAEEWATDLVAFWSVASWGFPKGIISDRDPKFLGEFWKRLFKETNTNFMYTTAWHPQAGGQSERTNQTVEIALRFFADDDRFDNWLEALPAVMRTLNSTVTSTGKTPDELLFGFNPWIPFPEARNPQADRLIHIREAADAIRYAQEIMKIRYDQRHTPS